MFNVIPKFLSKTERTITQNSVHFSRQRLKISTEKQQFNLPAQLLLLKTFPTGFLNLSGPFLFETD